jgi:GrpB-like predicted nucleotidyltransferase (UPF0157 family)
VLDVLAVFVGYEAASTAADALAGSDYDRRKDEPAWIQLTRDAGCYSVFVHFRPRDSEVWRDQLIFREYLRETPAARRRYERAKREAVAAHADNPEAYTDAKEAAVLELEAAAYEAGYDERLPDLG